MKVVDPLTDEMESLHSGNEPQHPVVEWRKYGPEPEQPVVEPQKHGVSTPDKWIPSHKYVSGPFDSGIQPPKAVMDTEHSGVHYPKELSASSRQVSGFRKDGAGFFTERGETAHKRSQTYRPFVAAPRHRWRAASHKPLRPKPAPIRVNPSESDPIKPDHTSDAQAWTAAL